MTLYMTLSAVRDHRIAFDTLFAVSPNAAAQSPTKMGFPVGTQVTVDNAIKMMMVKSANDMAVLLAEGIGGSIDDFAQQMTETAHRLGMTETNYVNPNGLPADDQITSARDLAILARALIREFPDYSSYWHIPAIKFGRRIVRNYNPLIGRYPGADGMKTGFICASGFNLVATATRDNKRLIAVVLGAPSGAVRAVKAAELLESGFAQNPLSWLTPSLGMVDALAPIDASPPNLKDEMCGRHRKRPAAEDDDPDADLDNGESPANSAATGPKFSVILSALRAPNATNLLLDPGPVVPVVVYTGPTRTPAQLANARGRTCGRSGQEKSKAQSGRRACHGRQRKLRSRRKASRPPKKTDGKATDGKATTARPSARHGRRCRPRRSRQAPPAELKAGAAAAAPAPTKPSARISRSNSPGRKRLPARGKSVANCRVSVPAPRAPATANGQNR